MCYGVFGQIPKENSRKKEQFLNKASLRSNTNKRPHNFLAACRGETFNYSSSIYFGMINTSSGLNAKPLADKYLQMKIRK